MRQIRYALGGAILFCFLLGLLAAPAGRALAADDTNPVGITIGSYSGTAGDDTFINLGTVTGNVDMRQGGTDTVINQGSVGSSIFGGSSSTGNTITNSGSVTIYIQGSSNSAANSSGGYYTITNSGTVGVGIFGSSNAGASSSGGYNIITNSGTVNSNLTGSYNVATGSSGGNNTIINSGRVDGNVLGSQNQGANTSGGDNTITNSGTVNGDIRGSNNVTTKFGGNNSITNSGLVSSNLIGSNNNINSRGGNNFLTNSGTVGGDLIGSYNFGDFSFSTGNTMTNSGSVTGSIYGSRNTGAGTRSGNDTITNSGTVGGGIYGMDGNDTVIMQTGSGSVGGSIDGGTGTDTIVYSGGTWSPGDPKVINFENVQVNATHNLTLNGAWNLGSDAATVSGGTLTVAGTLSAGSLTVNSGTANINGTATVSGNTQVDGTLNVNGGGTLNTGSLGIGSTGTANIYGSAYVSGATTVDGLLNVYGGGTLNTGSLGIGSTGTANIYGTTSVAGVTTVAGLLNVGSGGSFTTSSLGVSGGGSANIAGTATVSGNTQVDGSLSVASGGSLTTGSLGIGQGGLVDISGTLNTGSTDCAGYLHVNGTLNSPIVVIRPSGYLWGSGSIHGDITNYGIIAPGNSLGTLSVHSQLTFMPGSVYQAEITSDGASDRISIAGQAIINGGRVLTALPTALYTDRFAWNILSAQGGVSGSFEGVDGQPSSQTLSLHAVTYSDHVALEVWRKPFASFVQGGSRDLGAGLDGLVPLAVARPDSDLAKLIYTMDWSYSQEQITSALNRLSPEIYTSYLGAGLEGSAVFDGALRRRQDEARLGGRHNLHRGPQGESLLAAAAEEAAPGAEIPAAGPQLQGLELWGGALGSWSSRAGGGGRLGWRQNLGGLAGGVDYRINQWLTLGLGVGATQSSLDWGQSYLSGGLKGLHTGLYAGAEAGGLHGQAALAYSQYEAHGRRDINLHEVDPMQANGDFRSWVGQARLSGGYEWHWQDWLTGPVTGLRYSRIQQDGFQETGAGSLGLAMDNASRDSLNSNLGWQASANWKLGGWQIMPRLSLEWRHEFVTSQPEIKARFSGYGEAPFTVAGQAPVADLALVHTGVSARVRDRLSAFVDYDFSYGRDYSANAIQVGLQFEF